MVAASFSKWLREGWRWRESSGGLKQGEGSELVLLVMVIPESSGGSGGFEAGGCSGLVMTLAVM